MITIGRAGARRLRQTTITAPPLSPSKSEPFIIFAPPASPPSVTSLSTNMTPSPPPSPSTSRLVSSSLKLSSNDDFPVIGTCTQKLVRRSQPTIRGNVSCHCHCMKMISSPKIIHLFKKNQQVIIHVKKQQKAILAPPLCDCSLDDW